MLLRLCPKNVIYRLDAKYWWSEQDALAVSQHPRATPEYQFLGHEDNSLRRITYFGQEQSEYDVVLVIMESLNWTDIRYLGGDPMLMPALNCLAEQDVRMDRCF